ncbi:MAG: hypothetical protein IKU76_06140 [Bacteroidaceae bacterium]|nr:hypothetical protein [Bacteroidaceae bacterium]
MKKIFSKSLLLILLVFGGINTAYADWKSADSYDHSIHWHKTVLTLDQPYVTWSFPTRDKSGTDDFVRYSRMYVGADKGCYNTYMQAPSTYFEIPYLPGNEILYLEQEGTISQRQNGAWGVANTRGEFSRPTGSSENDIYAYYVDFYPGQNLPPEKLLYFFVRWTAWWDTDGNLNDNKYTGYWLTQGSAKLGSGADGAAWNQTAANNLQKDRGNGIVKYQQITFNIPTTKEVTYVRKPGGIIEAQIAGNDHAEWTEYYGFSNSNTKDANGYYTNSYGETGALSSGAKGTFTLPGTYDETQSFEFYYHQYYKRSYKAGDQTANMHFEAPRTKSTAKGFMYPSNLQITQDKWNKKVTLKWTVNNKDDNHNTDGGWLIFRQKKGESGYTLLTSSRLSNENKSYTDTNIETGAEYTYWVTFAPNSYGTLSEPITTKLSCSNSVKHDNTFRISDLNAEINPGANGGILLSWTPEKEGSDVKFEIQRWDNEREEFLSLNNSAQTATTYVDRDGIESWKEYKYRIKTTYWGLDFYSDVKNFCYTVMTAIKEVTASQGTYSNMVKLSWNVEVLSSANTRYVVYRKLLGDPQAVFTKIYELQGKESSFYYEDVSALPGQFYDYKVTAFAYVDATETEESKWVEGNSKEADGFVQTRGILTGRIKYGTGTAVQGAKVYLTKSDNNDNTGKQYYSMYLEGDGIDGIEWNSSEEVEKNYFIGSERPWSIQLYVRPEDGITGTQSILDVNGYAGVSVAPSGADYQLYVKCASGGGAPVNNATGIIIPSDKYSHIVFSYDGASTYSVRAILPETDNIAFVDGVNMKTFTGKDNVKFEDKDRVRKFTFGASGFRGYIDEIRVWTKALTDKEIVTYYDRLLTCTEANLLCYWPMDEGINGLHNVYDYSKTNGVANGNHALLKGNALVSEVVPTEEQLSLYGYTDENGNYVVRGVPFSGDGTTYIVRPVMGIHEFNPSYHTRYVSSNTLTHDDISFEDVSSFAVSGSVYYENTTYPVQGCNLYIDGEACAKDGKLIETDEFGRFEISVPIGDHHITIKKNGHTFVGEGRYPAGVDTKFTFDREVTNLTFYDNTLVNVAGRIVGGNIEGNKSIGFGLSTNNIGKAQIVLTPTNDLYSLNVIKNVSGTTTSYENNTDSLVCESSSDLINSHSWRGKGDNAGRIYINTDAKTGEFSAMVPPILYNVSAPVVIETTQTVGTAGIVDLSDPMTTSCDTIVSPETGAEMTFEYNAKHICVYHSEPTFTVTQDGFENGAFGIAEYEVEDELGKFNVGIVNKEGEPVYAYGTPMFIQGDPYTFKLKGYEQYTNYDNGEETTVVPLENCIVTISNALSDGQAVLAQVEEGNEDYEVGEVVDLESNQVELDANGEALYTWKAGFPNITAPYTRTISISYEIDGQENLWKYNDQEFMEGIILGALPSGNNFITSGPDKLQMILRDPPGSGSSAEWSSGTVTSREKHTGHCWNSETTIKLITNTGIENTVLTGTGVAIKNTTHVINEIEGGSKVTTEGENSKTIKQEWSITEAISTSDDPSFVGSYGDIYIGNSTNIVFGEARDLNFTRDANGNISLGVSEIMTVGSNFSTSFRYTGYYIENTLIPNLESMRNNLLITVSEEDYENFVNDTDHLMFVTKLSPDDEKFGSDNNDTEVWGKNAAEVDAIEGPSYKIVLPKRILDGEEEVVDKWAGTDLDQDTIRWANMQINNWKGHLRTNEEEKIWAWEHRADKIAGKDVLLKNFSFDGGSKITYTEEYDSSFVESHEHKTGALVVGKIKTGFTWNKVGWETELETETGGMRNSKKEDGTEIKTSFAFTLAESGDDALSVDVYRSKNDYSPMFRTRAGQTSAPYEDEERTRFYEPGQHVLHEATMQIEVPDIEVEVATVTNLTAGSAANYTLLLTNKSEIDCDLYYKLLMMDETNPNGAQLSIDGVALSDNRVIKVPAGEVVRKTLLLKQSNLGILDYENIGIVLASQEQGDPTGTYPQIADTVYVSAYYVPSSSPVKMELNRTLLNTSSGADLDITFNSFDRNYYNLKAFRIQYMKQGDTDWTTLKEYLRNVEEGQQLSSTQQQLPDAASVTYSLDMSSFTDGKYTFRVLSASTYGTGESTLVTDAVEVVKDMARPMPFGTPKPTTGFLGMGDDIELTFNEDINSGRLTSTGNFLVTAALNGAAVAHDIAMLATGTEGAVAKTEASINLIGKSFAVDMWVRISGEGTIFSHGNGTNKIVLGIKEIDGKFYFAVNGEVCSYPDRPLPADKWIYLAFNLDQEHFDGTCYSVLYADDATSEYLASEMPIEKYEGNGAVALGDGFTGAIHEVTLWDEAIDVTTLQSQMYETKMPTTEHLIGYWKFNEGLGTQAKDFARNRHMNLSSTSWYMNNKNKSLNLVDGLYDVIDDAMVINTGDCPARTGDDYMVEMWFNAETTQDNDTAYIFDTDAFGVALLKGKMNLYSRGSSIMSKDNKLVMAMGNKSYTDGKWHHLAINVIRNGNTIAYVDGEAVGQVASTNVPALQSAWMHLGTHCYRIGSVEVDTMKYKLHGGIDEVRIWHATLNANVIRDRMNVRLKGDEPGLVAYYPFEEEKLDEYSQVVTVPTAMDMVTKRHEVTTRKNKEHVLEFVDEAPALKPLLNETNVNYNFVASERGIVIELNEDAARLEGVTVNVTVKDVLDLNGNKSLPITWTALVQRNQLLWFENEVEVVGRIGEEKKFTATVTNQSAQTEYWALNDLPSWLSANFTSGSLPALGNQEITFTVDASAPTGKSEFTVYMSGNNAILVPLTVNMNLRADAPEWSVDPSDFESSATLFGAVMIDVDGKIAFSEDEDDLVAAFIDGKCVGVTNVQYDDYSDSYRAYLTIYGNSDDENKEIKLMVWDASTDIIHPVVYVYDDLEIKAGSETQLTFSVDGYWGDYDNIYCVYASNDIQQSTPLKKNWNWISVYVQDATENEVNSVLESINPNGAVVKNANAYSEYIKETGWYGTKLTNLTGNTMYKLQMTAADTLVVEGKAYDGNAGVSLVSGWNWIPYYRSFSLSLDDAFASIEPARNDQVKGQEGFAMYNGTTWNGTLKSLQPGKGYLYKSVSEKTLNYPSQRNVATASLAPMRRMVKESMFSPVDPTEYESNMTVLAVVKDGDEILENVQEIAVFDGAVCLASTTMENDGFFYLTIPGDKTVTSRLTIVAVIDGNIVETSTSFYFVEDATLGDFDAPFAVTVGNATTIGKMLAEGDYCRMQIVDLNGRVLYSGATTDFNENDLHDGQYIFEFFTTEGQIVCYKQLIRRITE